MAEKKLWKFGVINTQSRIGCAVGMCVCGTSTSTRGITVEDKTTKMNFVASGITCPNCGKTLTQVNDEHLRVSLGHNTLPENSLVRARIDIVPNWGHIGVNEKGNVVMKVLYNRYQLFKMGQKISIYDRPGFIDFPAAGDPYDEMYDQLQSGKIRLSRTNQEGQLVVVYRPKTGDWWVIDDDPIFRTTADTDWKRILKGRKTGKGWNLLTARFVESTRRFERYDMWRFVMRDDEKPGSNALNRSLIANSALSVIQLDPEFAYNWQRVLAGAGYEFGFKTYNRILTPFSMITSGDKPLVLDSEVVAAMPAPVRKFYGPILASNSFSDEIKSLNKMEIMNSILPIPNHGARTRLLHEAWDSPTETPLALTQNTLEILYEEYTEKKINDLIAIAIEEGTTGVLSEIFRVLADCLTQYPDDITETHRHTLSLAIKHGKKEIVNEHGLRRVVRFEHARELHDIVYGIERELRKLKFSKPIVYNHTLSKTDCEVHMEKEIDGKKVAIYPIHVSELDDIHRKMGLCVDSHGFKERVCANKSCFYMITVDGEWTAVVDRYYEKFGYRSDSGLGVGQAKQRFNEHVYKNQWLNQVIKDWAHENLMPIVECEYGGYDIR